MDRTESLKTSSPAATAQATSQPEACPDANGCEPARTSFPATSSPALQGQLDHIRALKHDAERHGWTREAARTNAKSPEALS